MALGRIAHLLAAPLAAAHAAAAAPARAGGLTSALARLQAPTAPPPRAGLSRALGRLAIPGAQPPAAPPRPAAPPPPPHVDVGAGLRIIFDQAGEGPLHPAWQGRILSNGHEVGWFKSDGPASTTIIQSERAVDVLQAAVDASAPELNLSHLVKRENLVLTFAEAKLFAPGAATLTLHDVVLKAARAQPAPPQAPPKIRLPAPPRAAKRPTFAQARAMLLAGLRAHGWEVRADLTIPWAASAGDRLWFKPEAIYYGNTKSIGDARSISSDMREFATVDALLRAIGRPTGSEAAAPAAATPPPSSRRPPPGSLPALALQRGEGPGAPPAPAPHGAKPAGAAAGAAAPAGTGVQLLERDGFVQLKFEKKPDETTRERLGKVLGFRWFGPQRVWSRKASPAALQVAQDFVRGYQAAGVAPAPTSAPILDEDMLLATAPSRSGERPVPVVFKSEVGAQAKALSLGPGWDVVGSYDHWFVRRFAQGADLAPKPGTPVEQVLNHLWDQDGVNAADIAAMRRTLTAIAHAKYDRGFRPREGVTLLTVADRRAIAKEMNRDATLLEAASFEYLAQRLLEESAGAPAVPTAQAPAAPEATVAAALSDGTEVPGPRPERLDPDDVLRRIWESHRGVPVTQLPWDMVKRLADDELIRFADAEGRAIERSALSDRLADARAVLSDKGLQRFAAEVPMRAVVGTPAPVAPPGAAPNPLPRRASYQDLLHLPIDTRLIWDKHNDKLLDSPRVLVAVQPRQAHEKQSTGKGRRRREVDVHWNEAHFALRLNDPEDPRYGSIDWFTVRESASVTSTPNGFTVRQGRDTDVFAFDTAERAPASIGTWQRTLGRAEAVRQERDLRAFRVGAARWLQEAVDTLETAKERTASPSVLAREEAALVDAQRMSRASSPRDIDPATLERLIERMHDQENFEGLLDVLVRAHEEGAHGVPSAYQGQGLFDRRPASAPQSEGLVAEAPAPKAPAVRLPQPPPRAERLPPSARAPEGGPLIRFRVAEDVWFDLPPERLDAIKEVGVAWDVDLENDTVASEGASGEQLAALRTLLEGVTHSEEEVPAAGPLSVVPSQKPARLAALSQRLTAGRVLAEHQAEARTDVAAGHAPCATEEGVLAATLGRYRTAAEVSALLGGCDVEAVRAVLERLTDTFKLRKTHMPRGEPYTAARPERWGHDVPPYLEDWAVHRVGDQLYGDTKFLDAARAVPGFTLTGGAMGLFKLHTPKGDIAFDPGYPDFPGQSGRSHLISGPPEALALLKQELHVEERLAEQQRLAQQHGAPPEVAQEPEVVEEVGILQKLLPSHGFGAVQEKLELDVLGGMLDALEQGPLRALDWQKQVDKRAKVRVTIRDALYELPWLDDASVVDATTRIFEHFLGESSTPAAPHETPAPSARGPRFVLMDRVEVIAGRHVNHTGTVVAARGPAGGRSNERLVRIDVQPTQPELKVTIPDEHLQRLGPREEIAPSRGASSGRGILTAFREGLNLAQPSGAADAHRAPVDALRTMLGLGRDAETAGEIDRGAAGRRWELAIDAMLHGEGDKAAFFVGSALAEASARRRAHGYEVLEQLEREAGGAPAAPAAAPASVPRIASAADRTREKLLAYLTAHPEGARLDVIVTDVAGPHVPGNEQVKAARGLVHDQIVKLTAEGALSVRQTPSGVVYTLKPVPSHQATEPSGFPRIDSVAALKRLPIGTTLYLIRTLKGPQSPSARSLMGFKGQAMLVRVEDPTSKYHGQETSVDLRGMTLHPTFEVRAGRPSAGESEAGFVISDNQHRALAEYVFDAQGAAAAAATATAVEDARRAAAHAPPQSTRTRGLSAALDRLAPAAAAAPASTRPQFTVGERVVPVTPSEGGADEAGTVVDVRPSDGFVMVEHDDGERTPTTHPGRWRLETAADRSEREARIAQRRARDQARTDAERAARGRILEILAQGAKSQKSIRDILGGTSADVAGILSDLGREGLIVAKPIGGGLTGWHLASKPPIPVSADTIGDRVLAATLEAPQSSLDLAAMLGTTSEQVRAAASELLSQGRLRLVGGAGDEARWVNPAMGETAASSPPTEEPRFLLMQRVRVLRGAHEGRVGTVVQARGASDEHPVAEAARRLGRLEVIVVGDKPKPSGRSASRVVLLDATPLLPAERARIADGDLTHVRPATDVAIPQEAAAARGLLTAFREGLERARFTGAPDATPPPDDALQRIVDRGRIAERAGDLDLGEAGLTWSTAVSSMLAGEGDKAAYFTGEALAQASAKQRGRGLDVLRDLEEEARKAAAKTPAEAQAGALVLAKLPSMSNEAQRVLAHITADLKVGEARTIDRGKGYMAVSVDRVGPSLYAVAHHYEQNGDLVADPDMEFWRADDGRFFPVAIEQHGERTVAMDLTAGGPETYVPGEMRDLAAFATTWMRNIAVQQGLDLRTPLPLPGQEEARAAGSPTAATARAHSEAAPVSTLAKKAAAMWAAFNTSQRAGVRVGMFPHGPMQQAEREGFNGKDLAVALMQHAAGGAGEGGAEPVHAPQAPVAEAATEEQPEGSEEGEEPEPSIAEVLTPVEHRTAAARRDANIKAMWLAADLEAHPRPLSNEDRLTLAAYSDWGGIGIEKARAKFPPGFPVPEPRQLIHAYFTPPLVCAEIARVVRPLLPGLTSTDARVHALEPAVGIGRFPLALSGPGFENVVWHCVEFSLLSYKMLHALRPDIDLYQGPFERWVAEHEKDYKGKLKLVISNPPYGARPFETKDDPDRSYRYKRADDYFLRRGLDLLGAGGLGVYIIPSGFLTGKTDKAVALRQEVLRRHHLAAAFRLPNEVFSLANVVTDILFFRARGEENWLKTVDDTDRFIVEGRYYEQFPAHILGRVVPNEPGNDASGKKKRQWHASAEGYTVVGDFTSLPPVLEERPMCTACEHTAVPVPVEPPKGARATKATASAAEQIIEDDERMAAAASLGHRVDSFLANVSNPDIGPVGWEELHDDLQAWADKNGPPAQDRAVLALASAERGPLGKGPPGGAGWLLKAFVGKSTTLIEGLATKPPWEPSFIGNKSDPLQVGEYIFRTHKKLAISQLPGEDPSTLFAAGWCEDSLTPAWTERLDVRGDLFPPDEYLAGELWPRFDRAQKRAALGDQQAATQAARLLALIQPATFGEFEVSPQDGFVPLEMLAAWLTSLNHDDPVQLVREDGIIKPPDVDYDELKKAGLSYEAIQILGWVNHDYVEFQPAKGEDEKLDDERLRLAQEWTQRFRAWIESDPARQRAIEHAYQRARQGYRAHGYGSEPLKLARWNPAVVLNAHQIAGARRLEANRGGGLGFDVGVGKTFTILAALALARQAGRARRAVIVVPQPIAFQWVLNVEKALPGFRTVVIGINKTKNRTGGDSSRTDTPEERSRKWARFQGGEYDVAILTYDALPRTQMDQESTLRFIEHMTAIAREVALSRRNKERAVKGELRRYEEENAKLEERLEEAVKKLTPMEAAKRQGAGWVSDANLKKARDKVAALRERIDELKKKHLQSLTERQDAVLAENVGRWLGEKLELPATWKPDPDIVWNKLGITWIAFDEAHAGKNLHMPSSREGGVPKYMGNEGEGSKRAWAWFFRCCDVQARGGEVVLATATPASNSPLELYNLVKLIDKDAWNRVGIYDPEAFIDRFCLLEQQEVLNSEMEAVTSLACVGFKNLDELRSVIFKFWEFKTAKQAGLKLPEVKVERVPVAMDADQEAKYVDYLKQIEEELGKPKIPGSKSNKILGLLARMAMVAMHAQLDEGFDWKTAHRVSSPQSPKFKKLAEKILAQRGCGHIVFADYIAAHVWIRDVLIEAGIPADKIGVLNAVVAPNAAERLRIARDFNAGKYDVLIANAIGEEGLDLQDRTCAIHHLDIGWTPKKTEQRNGRGVRQGNSLKNINIYYYIAERSQDGARLDMVRGKQNWISSLIEGEAKDTNNPAAQSTLSREELLVLISRDPKKTEEAFAKVKAQREEERKTKIAKAATDTLRAVADRFSRARTEKDPTTAAEYRSTARQKLEGLTKVPADVWPWAAWASAAVDAPMLVPKVGAPVYEGLRVAMPSVVDREVIQYVEFGRVDGANIATRVAGAAHWEVLDPDKLQQLHLEPGMRITEASTARWPGDDQAGIDKAMEAKWLHRLRHGAGAAQAWRDLGWHRAPDAFVAAQWERWGGEIVRAMASTGGWAQNLQIPAVRRGILIIGLTPPFEEVIPPTLAGWQRFLELAPLAGEKFTPLETLGREWFGRSIPRNLLSANGPPPSARAA